MTVVKARPHSEQAWEPTRLLSEDRLWLRVEASDSAAAMASASASDFSTRVSRTFGGRS